MTLNNKDKRVYIKTLQSLQKDINSLNKAKENNPLIEITIEILRNSQDKLYSALAQHGVTTEDVYRVIMENADKQLIKDIMQLQKAKTDLKSQLFASRLSPEKRQYLEDCLNRATQQHRAKWDEVIARPNKDELIKKIERAQIRRMHKAQSPDKDLEPERSR